MAVPNKLARHLDASYFPSAPPNTLHTFDVYIPERLQETSQLVCFIHGGAWRSEDKADHSALASQLALSTGCPVAVPNYRLTPREPAPHNHLRHPAHAQDLLRFLEFVLSWHVGNGGRLPRKPSKLFLIGHSCSAHMLCTIFLHTSMPDNPESIRPSDELIQATRAIIMSEGIYDIDLLLSSFPRYRTWFIEHTFGKKDSYENVSAMKTSTDPRGHHIRWFVMHSKGDSLVDERQSREMYDFLTEISCFVSKSFDDLEGDHNAILNSPRYVEMVEKYIQDVVGRCNEYALE